jgi:hypothetical protein
MTSSSELADPAKVIAQFLQFLSRGSLSSWSELWADDAVQLMPYAPEGFPKRLDGRARIVRHYENVLANKVDGVRFTDILIFGSADARYAYAQYRGESVNRSTGKAYRQQYAGMFEFENGLIRTWTEYFNPLPFIDAYDGGHNAALVAGATAP